MNNDHLDHILAAEPEILPSSGFSDSLMNSVRREASTPAPLSFPWKRALPAFVAMAVLLIAFLISLASAPHDSASSSLADWLATSLAPLFSAWRSINANWILLSLAVTVAALRGSALFLRTTRSS